MTAAVSRPEELARQMDDFAKRLRVLEGRALTVDATPTFTPAPTAPVVPQTIVVLDMGVGARLFGTGGGTFTIASGGYTIGKAGSLILEGQLDCRAEYWDDYVSAPKRDVWTDSGGPGANGHTQLPSGLVRLTVTNRSNPLSVAIGSYTASWQATFTGGNQLHVYGGWLRVTWTG